jgi:hypothetical protein
MLAPNLLRRCRQTGLDAKGVTQELLRLKCYCSWTGNFFFFSLSVCLVHHLIIQHLYLLISLVLHFFFLFLFSPFLILLVLLL